MTSCRWTRCTPAGDWPKPSFLFGGSTGTGLSGALSWSDVVFPVWTADLVRKAEAEPRTSGIGRRGVLAVNEATGDVAALTLLDFYPTLPSWGVQRDSVVIPSERGHGLGLCVKARMLRWLREQRPDIARVHTGTGSGNEHMIRINHLLGHRTTSVSVGVNAKISELRDRPVEAAGRKIESPTSSAEIG
ncbi:hypothetical protein DFR72_117122 [Lentzea flaviverrucosa]|uniref:Acetyltransferase (GNAT) family protein n=1 Tax=Lentzea flaviverrucosa TaxID=200379 RepID=A0A1H9XSY3_9PSEU|nr:hypothetical protein DFR72_117122 [Lentzea flaviverrucosa]SES49159.1 hypothetical protein SAMN05216195_11796 [Lentzea flaviverrucosa]